MSSPSSSEIPAVEELDAEQNELTEEYLRLRSDSENDSKAKRDLQKVKTKLNGLYWKRVRSVINERAGSGDDNLDFDENQRLLVDMGLLDVALVENAEENFRDVLLEELNTTGAINHYYLTEWLEDRFRRYLLTQQMEEAESANAEEDTELGQLQAKRKSIYSNLRPYFKGLPGVNDQIVEHMVTGRLEDQLQGMSISLLEEGNRSGFIRRHGLVSLRYQVLGKLRARVREEKHIKLLDALETIYRKTWSEHYTRYTEMGSAESAAAEVVDMARSKRQEYLESELKFARNLLPLGALAGGIARPVSVLLENRPRITKKMTNSELERVRECDRGFTADPVVLIAPYEGRGFFEWDRDSLFIPLVPVESPADAIGHATGNYRMLIDSLQEEGNLKAAYEGNFEGANFQQSFQADYRAWVCNAGYGKSEGMEDEHFNFFREHIGPDCDSVLAPANLRHLGPEARESLIKRLEKQVSLGATDANIHARLGVLYWQEDELTNAVGQLARSVGQNPGNGMATFSLGLLLQKMGNEAKARQAFEVCRNRVPESIWTTYSSMALEGQL